MENLNQQKQGLDDWVNQQADARAQQLAYQQQQQSQEDKYRELEELDPYAASIQKLQDQVANVQKQVQQDTSQLKNQVAQSAWETKKAEFAKDNPDLQAGDWDTIYAKVALGTPMETAVNERAGLINLNRTLTCLQLLEEDQEHRFPLTKKRNMEVFPVQTISLI